jgi:hypothetical protein
MLYSHLSALPLFSSYIRSAQVLELLEFDLHTALESPSKSTSPSKWPLSSCRRHTFPHIHQQIHRLCNRTQSQRASVNGLFSSAPYNLFCAIQPKASRTERHPRVPTERFEIEIKLFCIPFNVFDMKCLVNLAAPHIPQYVRYEVICPGNCFNSNIAHSIPLGEPICKLKLFGKLLCRVFPQRLCEPPSRFSESTFRKTYPFKVCHDTLRVAPQLFCEK